MASHDRGPDAGGRTAWTNHVRRIAIMKTLNRHVERVFNPERKDTHWGNRKLKRDQ